MTTIFRMIECAKIYPYFNEDAEINWKDKNLNKEMAQNMAKFMDRCSELEVHKIDWYKVHSIQFKRQRGTSLPMIDCSKHQIIKETYVSLK